MTSIRICAVSLLLLLSLLCASGSALAEEETTVVILPFEVNTEPDLAYLSDSLPEQLARKLTEKGLKVVDVKEADRLVHERGVSTIDLAAARSLAQATGANYAVYGSVSQVGQSVSLDARLVEASGTAAAVPVFVVKDAGSIIPAIDELTEKIKVGTSRSERIAAIEVEGTHVLEKDVVLSRLKIQVGDAFDPKVINDELKRLYNLGYFDDVQFQSRQAPDGLKLVIVVKEKPRIQSVTVKGNSHFDQDDILQAMGTKAGAVLNLKLLSEDLGKIREMYRKDGFYKADVNYQIEDADRGVARLTITVNEGQKLYIRKISIQGANALSESDLKGQLSLAERGWLSWLTGSGILKEELLERDSAALEAYYGNRGFVDVKVGQPDVDFKDDGIYITFKVQEGPRYKVGAVDFTGDMLVDKAELRKISKVQKLSEDKDFFDRSAVRDDEKALTDYYTNFGYAKAETDVSVDKGDGLTVNVTYIMTKHQMVYIRRVIIEGNEKTRDNVIRRNMRLTDGSLYSGEKLRRSNERLNKLDFFDKVEIEPVTTDDPSEIDLKVKVKEKATGQLSAGAGYSSFDGPFVTGTIAEHNLFGKGYDLGFTGTFGGRTTEYKAAFTNPSVNDTDLAMGADAYVLRQNWFDYDKDTVGGGLRWGYPLGEYTNLFWGWRIDNFNIKNVDSDASAQVKDMENLHWASVANIGVKRDTTDAKMNPTKGTINTLTVENGGGIIGGDDNHLKYIGDSSWYTPLFWKTVFHLHGQIGYIMKNTDNDVPLFEKFYLGGINNVRGYSGDRIAPRNSEGDYIGGNKEAFGNAELIFPLYKEFGLMGVTFFDIGNTWDFGENMSTDLYKSVGAGLRWYSPMGPLRLEYGFPLDTLDNSSRSGRIEFSMGQFF